MHALSNILAPTIDEAFDKLSRLSAAARVLRKRYA
jgi:hypothetical protein